MYRDVWSCQPRRIWVLMPTAWKTINSQKNHFPKVYTKIHGGGIVTMDSGKVEPAFGQMFI